MMTATEHADVAIISNGRLELDADPGVLGKGPHHLVMRDLDEIGLCQDADELVAETAIGRFEIRRRTAGLRIDLRVEVKIHLAQPIQFLEILVVKDSPESAGQLPEAGLTGLVETAFGDKATDQVRLPQPNDTVKSLRRGRIAHQSHRLVVHEKPACTQITARLLLKSEFPTAWRKGLSRKHDFISLPMPTGPSVRHGREATLVTKLGSVTTRHANSGDRSCPNGVMFRG